MKYIRNVFLSFQAKIKDQFLQKWDSTSGVKYRIIKNEFGTNNYFKNLLNKDCRILTAFRTRNHKLLIEKEYPKRVHDVKMTPY